MTSQFPPAAVPGPDGAPEWEEEGVHQQPDPFGEETDEEGGTPDTADNDGRKNDPRAE
jgi:hypothetical protein